MYFMNIGWRITISIIICVFVTWFLTYQQMRSYYFKNATDQWEVNRNNAEKFIGVSDSAKYYRGKMESYYEQAKLISGK